VFSRTNTEPPGFAGPSSVRKHQRMAIHGNKSQGAPPAPWPGFKNRRDARAGGHRPAARASTIEQLPHVGESGPATSRKNYVHRIGRTAAPGQSGHALSWAAEEHELLRADRKGIASLARQEVPGFSPPPSLSGHPSISAVVAAKGAAWGGGRSGADRGGPRPGRYAASQRPSPAPFLAQPGPPQDKPAGGRAEAGPKPYGLPRNIEACSSTRAHRWSETARGWMGDPAGDF